MTEGLRSLLRHAPDWKWWTGIVGMAEAVVMGANALAGTGLSPSAEPLRVSSASPLPSLSQSELQREQGE